MISIGAAVNKFWILLFFGIIIVFVLLLDISYKKIISDLQSLTIFQLLVIIVIFFIISLANIFARKILIQYLFKGVSIKNLIFIHFASMAAHYSTPVKIGFPLTVFLLNKMEDVPYSRGAAVVILELAYGLAVSGVIALLGTLFFFRDRRGEIFIGILLLITIGAVLIALAFITGKFERNRVGRFLSELREGLAALSFFQMIQYLFIRVGVSILGAINLIIISFYLSFELSVFEALVSSESAFFVGAMSMVPMGLGAREASMLFYLDFFGMPLSIAVAVITLQRLVFTGLTFVIGSVLLAISGIQDMKKNV